MLRYPYPFLLGEQADSREWLAPLQVCIVVNSLYNPKSAVRSLFTLLVNAAADESRSRAQPGAGRQSRR